MAKRRDDEFTEELRLTTYASRLARYPADVVREVTGATYTFWPTWEEMEKRLRGHDRPAPSHDRISGRGPKPPEPSYRMPTAEARRAFRTGRPYVSPTASGAEKQDAMDLAMSRVKVMGE